MKYFIITIDTEGDNLWSYKDGEPITTRNALYIPRFQSLCEQYGLKPTYLANLEMLDDENFTAPAKKWIADGTCEVGLHLHAWNTPPHHPLSGPYTGASYLIEYPTDVMRAKFKTLYDRYLQVFGAPPVSHRSGRWAMDSRYFDILKEFGIKVDASVTPGKDWSKDYGVTRGGSDYTKYKNGIQYIDGIMEVPPSIYTLRYLKFGYWKATLKYLLKGEYIEIRPSMSAPDAMIRLVDHIKQSKSTDYAQFMIHSSEFMPGGSPYFPTEESVDRLFDTMRRLFAHVRECGYEGVTLNSFYQVHK